MKKTLALGLIAISTMVLTGCSEGKGSSTSVEKPSSEIQSSEPVVNYWSGTYSNPTSVVYGSTGADYKAEIADPSFVRGDDGYFYVFATDGAVLRSEDGCNFEYYKKQVIDVPKWGNELPGGASIGFHIWAPDVVKIGDNWIYYYSLSAWGFCAGVGYAICDTIDGDYVDMGKLFSVDEIGIQNCIDPQVYVDEDGSVYMTVGSFQGLYVLDMEEDGLSLAGGIEEQKKNKTLIAGYPGPWDGSTYEGSYIVQKDGYYYYFGSCGTCCEGKNSSYEVRVGRSETIYGPYVDSQGKKLTDSKQAVKNGDLVVWAGASKENYAGPGHCSVFEDDAGDFWLYYHAYSSKDSFKTRHLFMDKLLWDENDMPYVETKKPSFDEEKDGPRFIVE